uniref:POC1 centriolar B n=1 Tax=Aceria tosichella TaxID=561515 RepID=A0A6G1S6Y1_9ACAR
MNEFDIFSKDPEPFVALTKTHSKAVLGCCFSPITNQILTAGEDGKVVLWNIPPTDTVLHDETINDEHKLVCYNLEEHKTPVTSVSMAKDLFVSASEGGQAKLWRLRPEVLNEPISGPVSYTCHTRKIFSCSLSLDAKCFATGSDDKSIKVWSTESKNKSLFTLVDGHKNWIRGVQFSKTHERLLASCGDDGRLCIWDVRTGVRTNPCVTIPPTRKTPLICLDWHPVFEHHIATGAQDSSTTIWDLRNRKRVQVYNEHEGQVNSVAFNTGGSLLLTGSADCSSRIFDCLEGRNIFNLLAHKSSITSTCFDPSGELFATASTDKTVTIWKRNFDVVTIVLDYDDVDSDMTIHGQSHDRNSNPPDLTDDWSHETRPSQQPYHRNNMYRR